ncbi:hypothetical protein IMZ48_15380 [Candidatus Bathyarchaeota archaeon]|nr:hypothetical protein [Candidatus Bathyarchaeota archaeon]
MPLPPVLLSSPSCCFLLTRCWQTTIGIPILILLVRMATSLASRTSFGQPPGSIQSGYYGSPPNWRWWLKQSLLYFCGLFGMKLIVLIIFYAFPWLPHVGDWALGWTEGNERLQIVFVMMLFPVIMNAMQYYIIDSFIKKQPGSEREGHERVPGEDPDDDRRDGGDRQRASRSYDGLDSVDGSSSSDGVGIENEEDMRMQRSRRLRRDGYDSEVDADAQTVIASSGSSREHERGTLIPKE